ncbi:MAG: S1/P1 nuclease [Burkholderiaceae bacterium]
MKPARLAAALLLLAAAAQAPAFGPHGHQAVGGIADQLLAGTPAGRQVRSLLGSNLQVAAVWADCAKGVGQKQAGAPFVYDGSGPYPECSYYENPSSQAAMEDFVRRNAKNCYSNSSDEVCRHKSYHYTDVSLLQNHYARGLAGTSDHDVVAAIQACIAVLQGRKSPAPFDIRGKKEALRLLAHYLGDVHQPLHVVAVYLDPRGRIVDPDVGAFDPRTSTKGGNLVLDGSSKLHAQWDSVPGALIGKLLAGEGAGAARQLPATPGPVDGWAVAWASDTIVVGKPALSVLHFGARGADGNWPATHPASYPKDREALQRQQIVKAGARLAELLRAIWP